MTGPAGSRREISRCRFCTPSSHPRNWRRLFRSVPAGNTIQRFAEPPEIQLCRPKFGRCTSHFLDRALLNPGLSVGHGCSPARPSYCGTPACRRNRVISEGRSLAVQPGRCQWQVCRLCPRVQSKKECNECDKTKTNLAHASAGWGSLCFQRFAHSPSGKTACIRFASADRPVSVEKCI